MARDRQRAKQRKARRAAQNPGPAPSQPHRSDVPGEMEHSASDLDQFEAAIIRGADGEPLDADAADDDVTVHATVDAGAEPDEESGDTGEVYDDEVAGLDEAAERDEWLQGTDEDLDEPDPELERQAVAAAPARARRAANPEAATRPGAPTRRGPGLLIGFLASWWAELQ